MIEAFQDDALEILKDWETACLRANSTRRHEFYLALRRCAHNLKGNAGLVGFDQMKDAIHRLEERLISLDESNAKSSEPSLLMIFFEIERFLREWIKHVVADSNYQVPDLNVLAKLEAWSPDVGADGQGPTPAPIPSAPTENLFSATETVRLPAQKLDSLIQQIGELTLSQAIVSRARQEDRFDTHAVKDAIAQCDKLVRGLRLTILDMRMLPMVGMYSKLERAAMELSIQLKKPLQFLVDGRDVAFDKAVMNRIFDPLLHVVRNAIDHGLESSEERLSKGKAAMGTIRVASSVVPSGVQIIVRDDGRGLNHEKIRQKAIDKKLILMDQKLTENQILDFIFEPGFSTADKVTDVSGRGIGLDVVKRELLNLGGQLEVKSTPGQGTDFVFTLPTNVSLIDVLVVTDQGNYYCVPTQDVAEILDLQSVQMETSALYAEMTKIRNRVMPIEPLAKFLKIRRPVAPKPDHENPQGCILVINYQDEIMGLRVEGVLEEQQVFVRPVKGYLGTIKHITGSTVLANGDPSLVVNVKQMADEFFEDNRRGARVGELII